MAPDHLRGVAITGRMPQEYDSILTPEAISFVAHLARMYTPRVNELLNRWPSRACPMWTHSCNPSALQQHHLLLSMVGLESWTSREAPACLARPPL